MSEHEGVAPEETKLNQPKLELGGNAWVLPSDPNIVGQVADEFERRLLAAGWSKDEANLPYVGFTEALNNAIRHGNLELNNQEKYLSQQAYQNARAAALASELAKRSVYVSIDVSAGLASVTVRDEGAGFDVASLPDPTKPELLLEEGGRGVFLMRMGFDEVNYNKVGNEVHLEKRRTAAVA